MLKGLNPSLLYLTVFVCGFVVMAFEIVGSRVLAPFLGTSTYIWVSIIGAILLAMSAGYYFGGKLADKNLNASTLSSFILFAAASMCLMNLGKNQFLMFITSMSIDSLITSTISAFVLFTIPAFMLAAVFPYVLRMTLSNIESTGKIAGRLYAISTFGSIAGTFLSATLLIPVFGTTNIIWLLAVLLIINSLLIGIRGNKIAVVACILLTAGNIAFAHMSRDYIDLDTRYNRVWIYDAIAQGRDARYMSLNGHVNAGMWIDNPHVEQLFPYSNYFQLAMHHNPEFEKSLMLGAGGYSFPKLYQHKWPTKELKIVEIDPALTDLSEEYFQFEPSNSTTITHQDARIYLNKSEEKFDIIINDVFTSPFEVPFHLTTVECYQKISDRLNVGGVLATNVLGSIDGEYSHFLKSQVKTLQSVFKHVIVYQVDDGQNANIKNNIVIALNEEPRSNLDGVSLDMLECLGQERSIDLAESDLVLSDEYAPANWLLSH